MTKRKYRNSSYLFFFFSVVFLGFLINSVVTEVGLNRLISSLMFGVLIIMQLRLALLLRRKSRELDLE
jgi:hypothetical protein